MESVPKRQRVSPPAFGFPPSFEYKHAYHQATSDDDELGLDFDFGPGDSEHHNEAIDLAGLEDEEDIVDSDPQDEGIKPTEPEDEEDIEEEEEYEDEDSMVDDEVEEELVDDNTELDSLPDAEKRAQNDLRLKSALESIFVRYGRSFEGIADEIDLETGKIVVDNGHLRKMQHGRDMGDVPRVRRVHFPVDDYIMDSSDDWDTDGGNEDAKMEDDLILRGNRFPQPSTKLSSSPRAPTPQNHSGIPTQFGPQPGHPTATYATTKQVPNNAHIEPAWRVPELPSLSNPKGRPRGLDGVPSELAWRIPEFPSSIIPETQPKAKQITIPQEATRAPPTASGSIANPAASRGGRANNLAATRTRYTVEDENVLLDFTAEARQQGSCLSSIPWKELEAKHPHHTACSWMSHYKRKYTSRAQNAAKRSGASKPETSSPATALLTPPQEQATHQEIPQNHLQPNSAITDPFSINQENISTSSCQHADCKSYPSRLYKLQCCGDEILSEMSVHLFREHKNTPFPCGEENCHRVDEQGYFLQEELLRHVQLFHAGLDALNRLRGRVDAELLDGILRNSTDLAKATNIPPMDNFTNQPKNTNFLMPTRRTTTRVSSSTHSLSSSSGPDQTPHGSLGFPERSTLTPITSFSSSMINPLSSTATAAEYMMNPLASDEPSFDGDYECASDPSAQSHQTPGTALIEPAVPLDEVALEKPEKLSIQRSIEEEPYRILSPSPLFSPASESTLFQNPPKGVGSYLRYTNSQSTTIKERQKAPSIRSFSPEPPTEKARAQLTQCGTAQSEARHIIPSPVVVHPSPNGTPESSLSASTAENLDKAPVPTSGVGIGKAAPMPKRHAETFARNAIDPAYEFSDEESGLTPIPKLPVSKLPKAKQPPASEQPVAKQPIADCPPTQDATAASISHDNNPTPLTASDLPPASSKRFLLISKPHAPKTPNESPLSKLRPQVIIYVKSHPDIKIASSPPPAVKSTHSTVPAATAPTISKPKVTRPAVKEAPLATRIMPAVTKPNKQQALATPTDKPKPRKPVLPITPAEDDFDELGADELSWISSAPRTNPLPRSIHVKEENAGTPQSMSAGPSRKRKLEMFQADEVDELSLDLPVYLGSVAKFITRPTVKKKSCDLPSTAAQNPKPRRASTLRNETWLHPKSPMMLSPSQSRALLSRNEPIQQITASNPRRYLSPHRLLHASREVKRVRESAKRQSSPLVVPKSEDSENLALLTPTRKNKFLDPLKSQNAVANPSPKCGKDGCGCTKSYCFSRKLNDTVMADG